ncbi:hypothetical protein BAE44_0007958, partial [Dichanthelium oligosanthes]
LPPSMTFLRPQINLNSLALAPRLEINASSICFIIRFIGWLLIVDHDHAQQLNYTWN